MPEILTVEDVQDLIEKHSNLFKSVAGRVVFNREARHEQKVSTEVAEQAAKLRDAKVNSTDIIALVQFLLADGLLEETPMTSYA